VTGTAAQLPSVAAGKTIGGSVWLIESVPPNSRVYNKPPAPVIKTKD
jgi:hypothetical protein